MVGPGKKTTTQKPKLRRNGVLLHWEYMQAHRRSKQRDCDQHHLHHKGSLKQQLASLGRGRFASFIGAASTLLYEFPFCSITFGFHVITYFRWNRFLSRFIKIKTESMNWGIIEYFHPNGRRIKFHAEWNVIKVILILNVRACFQHNKTN